MAFEEILSVLEQELHKRKVLLEGRGDRLEVAEQQLMALQEDNQKLRDRIGALEAGNQDGGINWRRRYEKLTGRHGRTVDALRQTIAEQGEEIQRLQAELHRYAREIADRAETHSRVREENALMHMELMDLRRKLDKATGDCMQDEENGQPTEENACVQEGLIRNMRAIAEWEEDDHDAV